MKHWSTGIFIIISLAGGICGADEMPALKDEQGRINYSVGYQVGRDFKSQGVEINPRALVQGVKDALAEKKPSMTGEEMRKTLVDLKKKIVTEDENQRKARIDRLREEGRKFMAENARKEGIATLPSGLQYKVLREGTGRRPMLNDTVTVNYRGIKIDGTEFDSSYKAGKPATFPLNKVIPGWKEALPMMEEGAKWKLFLPPKLAFSDKGPLENQAVMYEIELISIESIGSGNLRKRGNKEVEKR